MVLCKLGNIRGQYGPTKFGRILQYQISTNYVNRVYRLNGRVHLCPYVNCAILWINMAEILTKIFHIKFQQYL
jgi:hypothetical protein